MARPRWPSAPPMAPCAPGFLMARRRCAALYAVGIAGIAPRLGVTEGERQAGPALATQRLGMHLLFGVVTALVAEAARARLSASGR